MEARGAVVDPGMEVQGKVVEQLENLAVGPGGQRAADSEKVPGPAEGRGEAQAPLPQSAGPPGSGMEVQVEVMEQLEKLAVGPDGQRADAQEKVPGPAEGGGEAQAPVPPAAGPPRSAPPAWPGSPATAVSSSDSDSDTDSDSSSTTLFSSSSALSEEDDFPNEKDNRSYCVRTKDEVPIDKLPPVEDLTIILPDNVELKLFGTVSSIIEQLVIIESLRGLPPVNEESIIFKEDRQAVGKIFEIFGPVSHPFYVIRFNNSEHIKEKGINVQDSMYFAPSVEDFTQYIFAEKLKQEKGSDASWKNDQEPPSEVLDFSDDEKEREAKLKKKPQSQGRKKVKSETFPSSENKELHHSVQQPAPSFSRGCRGRGFSRDQFPPPSGPQRFFRPTVRPPQLYSSDRRMYQESPVFPPPYRRENPMVQQYAFPPPDFGYVSNGHQFHPPPSNTHMIWTGPNMYGSPYSFLPPPPPPPPPPPESCPPQFRPY